MGEIKNKRDRSQNFTISDTRLLVDLVMKRADIIENKKTDAATWHKKQVAWLELSEEFNSQSRDILRNEKTLKTKYESLKKLLRKKYGRNKLGTYETGESVVAYTDYEAKLLSIISFNADGVKMMTDRDNDLHSVLDVKAVEYIEPHFTDSTGAHSVSEEHNGHFLETTDSSSDIPSKREKSIAETTNSCHRRTNNIKWRSLNHNQTQKTINPRLIPFKRKGDNEKLNDKYALMTKSRQQLLSLQIEIAQAELKLKEQELEFARIENGRKSEEHDKKMELLQLQIDSFKSSVKQ